MPLQANDTTSPGTQVNKRPQTLEDYGLTPEVVARKIERYCELRSVGRQLALAGIRYQYPDATPAEIMGLFAARLEPSRREKWRGVCGQPPRFPE